MTKRTFQEFALTAWGGFVSEYDVNAIPLGVAVGADNCIFTPLTVETRWGYENLGNPGWSNLDIPRALIHVSNNNAGTVPIVSATGGALARHFISVLNSNYGSITSTPFTGDALSFARFTEDSGRAYCSIVKNGGGAWHYPQKLDPNANTQTSGTLADKALTVGVGPVSLRHATAAAVAGGTCTAGVHYIVAIMETYDGRRGPALTFPLNVTTTGPNATVSITNMGIVGGTEVSKVIFFMTPANPTFAPYQFPLGGYYAVETTTSGMVWTGGAINISVTDNEILSGTPIEEYLDTWPLPPCAGTVIYQGRQVAWGVLNERIPAGMVSMQYAPAPDKGTFNLEDLRFWSTDGAGGVAPAGWAVIAAGGVTVQPSDIGGGRYWRITGDGATPTRGQIRTNAAAPSAILGDLSYSLKPKTAYTVRCVARKFGTPAAGTLRLYAVNGSAGITVNATALTDYWTVYEGVLVDNTVTLPVNSPLSLESGSTLTNNVQIHVKDISIYETAVPIQENVLWISRAGDVEKFNLADGLVIIPTDTEGGITACFVLRGTLYVAKRTALYAVIPSDGEPNTWSVQKVSDTVGVDSPQAIGYGDGFVVLFGRTGIFYFGGGAPEKINKEHNSYFSSLPWSTYGTSNWCTVDSERKLVWFGFCGPGAVTDKPNKLYVLDYTTGWSDPLETPGSGRKWSAWQSVGYFATKKPTDGKVMFGASFAAGSIFCQYPALVRVDYSPDGAPTQRIISSNYITAPFPGLVSGTWLFGEGLLSVEGKTTNGLNVTGFGPSESFTIGTFTIPLAEIREVDMPMDYVAKSLRFQMLPLTPPSTADDYMIVRQLSIFAKKALGQNWIGG